MRTVLTGPNAQDRLGWVRELAFFCIAALASWYLTDLRYRVNVEFPLATLDGLIKGTANKPFQFRMLVPWIVQGLHSLTAWETKDLYAAVDAGATLGVYYATRFYLRSWFASLVSAVAAFSVFLILPWNFILARDIPIYLPYDMASIAFFTMGLAFLRRRWWMAFYPLLAVATVNREITVFLIVVFGISQWATMPRRSWALHLAAQSAIWIGIKTVLGSLYAANPGDALEFYHAGTQSPHLVRNLDVLTTLPSLFTVLSCFGFIWILLPLFWRRLSDRFLRQVLWITPPFLLSVILFGNIDEMRVYAELLPVILIPAIFIVAEILRTPEPEAEVASEPYV